jgi:hypothetical protein
MLVVNKVQVCGALPLHAAIKRLQTLGLEAFLYRVAVKRPRLSGADCLKMIILR